MVAERTMPACDNLGDEGFHTALNAENRAITRSLAVFNNLKDLLPFKGICFNSIFFCFQGIMAYSVSLQCLL